MPEAQGEKEPDLLKDYRTVFDKRSSAAAGDDQALLAAYAQLLKANAPAIQKVEFDWVDGYWIWLILDPSAAASQEVDERQLLEDYPEAGNDGFGYWLMELVDPEQFKWCLEVDVTSTNGGEVSNG